MISLSKFFASGGEITEWKMGISDFPEPLLELLVIEVVDASSFRFYQLKYND
jgi:hypothetical protein